MNRALNKLACHHERPTGRSFASRKVPMPTTALHDRFRYAGVLRLHPAVWADEPETNPELAPRRNPAVLRN
ncbi:MAG TPA: hypothetical protein PLX89_13430 [Verrucomicrobiota bacterium]|nr:hypothetical protein [Verrucomicrobiota bacterium]